MADLIKTMPAPYEPKRANRWLIRMITTTSKDLGNKKLQEWVVSESSRPKFKKDKSWKFWKNMTPDNINIVMRDPIGPSTSQVIYDFMVNDFKLDYDLELLDPTGVTIEKWEIRDCEILEVDFGSLDYDKDKIMMCGLLVKPNTAKLVF